MPSLTVENYLKAIFQQCQPGAVGQAANVPEGGRSASTGELAQILGVSAGTVTSMLKTLSATGLATYTPYEGVRLTSAGAALALRVLRRHRLIELFLVRTLALNWDEVHAEAEHMEHAVSDLLVNRIDEFLGFPKFDPHGDPIPAADGTFATPSSRSLAECEAGESFRLARVIDQSPEFLRFLSESGLNLDTRGVVVANRRESGVVRVAVAGSEASIGRDAAEKILVAT